MGAREAPARMESGELETTGSPELTSPAPDPLWRRLGHGALARLLDIVTPPLCLACHTPLASHNSLCPSCWSRIDFIRTPLCDRLGIPLPYDSGMGTLSAQAIANPPEYGRARYVARYDGVMRQLIHDRKFRDRHDATALFGRWLAIAGQELIAGADVLVPVPLHRLKLLKRRFNQAAILSAELACQTGVPHAPLALVRTRDAELPPGVYDGWIVFEEAESAAYTLRWRYRLEITGDRQDVLLINVRRSASGGGRGIR